MSQKRWIPPDLAENLFILPPIRDPSLSLYRYPPTRVARFYDRSWYLVNATRAIKWRGRKSRGKSGVSSPMQREVSTANRGRTEDQRSEYSMRDRQGERREKRRGATSIRGSTCSRVRTTLGVSALLSRKQAIVRWRESIVSPLSPIEIGDGVVDKGERRWEGVNDEERREIPLRGVVLSATPPLRGEFGRGSLWGESTPALFQVAFLPFPSLPFTNPFLPSATLPSRARTLRVRMCRFQGLLRLLKVKYDIWITLHIWYRNWY